MAYFQGHGLAGFVSGSGVSCHDFQGPTHALMEFLSRSLHLGRKTDALVFLTIPCL